MIKAEVNVTGRITRNAMIRTDKSGKPYVAFAMAISLPDAKNTTNEVAIFVSIPNGQQRTPELPSVALWMSGRRMTTLSFISQRTSLLPKESQILIQSLVSSRLSDTFVMTRFMKRRAIRTVIRSLYSLPILQRRLEMTSSVHGLTSVVSLRRMQALKPSNRTGCCPRLM